mgnify:CR=1 FL=1
MKHLTKSLVLTCFGILISPLIAMADRGEVVAEDVCGMGNSVIETDDGWYIAAEHYSGVFLYEGDIVFGQMKTYGFQQLTRDDGSDGNFWIEDYEFSFESAVEELCD